VAYGRVAAEPLSPSAGLVKIRRGMITGGAA